MAMRYPDAPDSYKGTTIQTGDWFEDFARDQMEIHWGISPKSYKSKEFQLSEGEGRYCEYKHDPHTDYGHLSIEIQERRQASGLWVVAGPLRCKQPYYVQGDKNEIWVLPTHMLIRWLLSKGVWVSWKDEPWAHVSDVIYDQIKPHEKFGTLRTIYLEYDEAENIGGIKITLNNNESNTAKDFDQPSFDGF